MVICAGLVTIVNKALLHLFHVHLDIIILQEVVHPLMLAQYVMLVLTVKVMDQQQSKFVMKVGIVMKVKFHQLLMIVLIMFLRSVLLVHIAHQE